MKDTQKVQVSEQQALELAEASREKEWKQPSFMRELYLGRFRLDLIDPYPLEQEPRPEFQQFFDRFVAFLKEEVDPLEIDVTGEYPDRVVQGLRDLGAFGMKIPTKYGGLGFTNLEYQRVMQLVGSVDGNLSALLSAHQSIGVPNPLKLFGSDELKQEYLPRCARGEISAFALTENEVGSDPARLVTEARLSEDGSEYILNGTKLWCTNGTLADLLVVMAKHPENGKISAFVVETAWPGVSIDRRCHFMGLRALANAIISFKDVRVPAGNLIGQEGRGLKIALTTLNDGRLSIPNGSVGTAQHCLEICRRWASERVQWGKPVGKHEAISHLLADMAATTFAMESIVKVTTSMADRGGFDIRLEAAASKEWNSQETWRIVDDTMQIRGGRGYETASSLLARGDDPIGVERLFRDYRINKIFEGSSEIMHLFMAREAVDKHLQVAGKLIDPRSSIGEKMTALLRAAAFYTWWYPTRWLGWSLPPRFARFGRLARHLRFIERQARKLSRAIFHGMVVYRGGLQNKQGFLFRLVDVADELFAMAASVSRAHALRQAGGQEAEEAFELADLACRNGRRRVKRLFHELWHNDDALRYRRGVEVLDGRYAAFEEGALSLDDQLERFRRMAEEETAVPPRPAVAG